MEYRWWLRGKRRREASALLNQELFLLGRDIQSSRGNLLLEYGCRKEPSPYRGIHSLYTYEFSRRKRIVFGGFGLFCGDNARGGIFLHRKEFDVGFRTQANLPRLPWVAALLPQFRRPKDPRERQNAGRLLHEMVAWFARYEDWIETRFGHRYRIGQLSHYQRQGRQVITWSPHHAWEVLGKWLTAGNLSDSKRKR